MNIYLNPEQEILQGIYGEIIPHVDFSFRVLIDEPWGMRTRTSAGKSLLRGEAYTGSGAKLVGAS